MVLRPRFFFSFVFLFSQAVAGAPLVAGCSVRTAATKDLWEPVASGSPDAGGDTLAIPGKGIPASCQVDPTKVKGSTQVDVPAGPFAMGCNALADTECRGDEKPEHMVTISDFQIDVTGGDAGRVRGLRAVGEVLAALLRLEPVHRSEQADRVRLSTAGDRLLRVRRRAAADGSGMGEGGARHRRPQVPVGQRPARVPARELPRLQPGDGRRRLVPERREPVRRARHGRQRRRVGLGRVRRDYYAVSPPTDPPGPAATSTSVYVGRSAGWLSDETWARAGARDWYEELYIRDTMGFRCAK